MLPNSFITTAKLLLLTLFPRACTLSGYRWTETAQARNARNQANWGVLKQVKRAKPGLLASGGLGPFAERILRALEARVPAKKRPMSRTVTGGEFRLHPHPCGPDRADSVEGMRGISTPIPGNPNSGQPQIRTIPTADNPDSGQPRLRTTPTADNPDCGQPRLRTTPTADNPDCGQPRLRTTPTADNPDCGQSRLRTIPTPD
jgi:hypothetical protein